MTNPTTEPQEAPDDPQAPDRATVARPEAVLRRVLDEVATPGFRASRVAVARWVLPLVAAVVVALVALGAVGLLGGPRPAATPAGPATGAPSTVAGGLTGPTKSSAVVVSADGTMTWPETQVTLEPPGDRHPALSASAAVAAYCRSNDCARGAPEVHLGLATTRGSGTARAHGSINPLVDRALVYALLWQTTCMHSQVPLPALNPTMANPGPCTFVALVDAGTGKTLFEFDIGTMPSASATPPGG